MEPLCYHHLLSISLFLQIFAEIGASANPTGLHPDNSFVLSAFEYGEEGSKSPKLDRRTGGDFEVEGGGHRLHIHETGVWGEWEYCDPGTYVTVFQLRIEEGVKDNSGLNTIRLSCTEIGKRDVSKTITSAVGDFGSWRAIYTCLEGLFTSFAVESQPWQGSRADDLGVTNIRMKCSNPNIGTLYGEGVKKSPDAKYLAEQSCASRQGICGLRTQVFADSPSGSDDTSLNNLQMKCCDIPDQAANCKPTDKWVDLIRCTSSVGSPFTCKYTYTRGVSRSNTETTTETDRVMNSVGFSFALSIPVIKASFEAGLSLSLTTGQSWSNLASTTWTESTTLSAEFTINPGESIVLQQVVGACSGFTVGSTKFRVIQ